MFRFPLRADGTPVHPVANLSAFDAGDCSQVLYAVRIDDRGDLLVYVWTGLGVSSMDDIAEEAEDYARKAGWEYDEDDVTVFRVRDTDVFSAVSGWCARAQEAAEAEAEWHLCADGAVLCDACAALPESVAATALADVDVALEDRQWRVIGRIGVAACDEESCAHCGAASPR